MRPTRPIALIALALAVAACTTVTVPSTIETEPGSTTTTAAPSTTDPGSTDSTVGTSRPDLSGLTGLSSEVKTQLEDLFVQAQEVRELPLLEVPTVTVLDAADFDARLLELMDEVADDIPADQALYRMMGLIGEEHDLGQMFESLYTEAVAGFYDQGEIVVPASQESLSVVERGTLLHEMVHALTDQHFGIDVNRRQMIDEERFDELAAFRALAEGDATLAEVQWVGQLPAGEMGEFIGESLEADTSVLEAMPRFIRDSLLFPYESGLGFVQALYGFGGWGTVNDAYVDMPGLPGSTEQVITPGDYTRDLPQSVPVVDVTVPGYDLAVSSVWGELGLRLMLDQGLGSAAALPAADGWGGDFYHQWFDGQNAALLIVYQGDTADDIEELRSALLSYSSSMVDEEDFVWVDELGGQLFFILADETPVGESIRTAVGLG
jgi:hypothetical protein